MKAYAGWPIEANNTAMSVDGIFLDETPNLFDEGNYTYLKRASSVVREESAFKDRFVGMKNSTFQVKDSSRT